MEADLPRRSAATPGSDVPLIMQRKLGVRLRRLLEYKLKEMLKTNPANSPMTVNPDKGQRSRSARKSTLLGIEPIRPDPETPMCVWIWREVSSARVKSTGREVGKPSKWLWIGLGIGSRLGKLKGVLKGLSASAAYRVHLHTPQGNMLNYLLSNKLAKK